MTKLTISEIEELIKTDPTRYITNHAKKHCGHKTSLDAAQAIIADPNPTKCDNGYVDFQGLKHLMQKYAHTIATNVKYMYDKNKDQQPVNIFLRKPDTQITQPLIFRVDSTTKRISTHTCDAVRLILVPAYNDAEFVIRTAYPAEFIKVKFPNYTRYAKTEEIDMDISELIMKSQKLMSHVENQDFAKAYLAEISQPAYKQLQDNSIRTTTINNQFTIKTPYATYDGMTARIVMDSMKIGLQPQPESTCDKEKFAGFLNELDKKCPEVLALIDGTRTRLGFTGETLTEQANKFQQIQADIEAQKTAEQPDKDIEAPEPIAQATPNTIPRYPDD